MIDIKLANEVFGNMIRNIYENDDSRFSKQTAYKTMRLIATSPESQRLINNSNYPEFRKNVEKELNQQAIQNKDANKILAMLIKELYTSRQGRCSKSTAIKIMKYLNKNDKLQNLISNTNYDGFEDAMIEHLS